MDAPKPRVPTLTIQHFPSTQEGQQLIAEQKPFILGGEIFQGYQNVPIRVFEMQLTDEELEAAHDVDGTKDRVWFKRRQRTGMRDDRKASEYRQRRANLRRERAVIRDTIKEDKAAGIPISPADRADLAEIDGRMQRLVDLSNIHQEEAAEFKAPPEGAEKGGDLMCPDCQKICPPGKNFNKWLKGHQMGAHTSPRIKKKAG